MGFEPMNNGFAIRPLGPLGYAAGRAGRSPALRDFTVTYAAGGLQARGEGLRRIEQEKLEHETQAENGPSTGD